MVSYRVLLAERNSLACEVAAKWSSIAGKLHYKEGYDAQCREYELDVTVHTAMQVRLWDADRALIDWAAAKNSVTRNDIYKEFKRLTQELGALHRLPHHDFPLNHKLCQEFASPARRGSHPSVRRIRWYRNKHMRLARMELEEGNASLAAQFVVIARAANRRIVAYRRMLMREPNPRDDTLLARRVMENDKLRQAALVAQQHARDSLPSEG